MTQTISTNLPRNVFRISVLTALLAAAGVVHADSGVTVYGRLDLGVRYSTNQTKTGDSQTEMMPGATSSSRWGVRGAEDLGGGLKAIFTLEGGIEPDTGTAAQSGRLFGRTSVVGLAGDFGSVTLGRQNSPAYDIEALNEPFGWANLYEAGFIYDNYTSKRWDNSMKYAGKFGAVSTSLMVGLGEQAGHADAKRNVGGSLGYAQGPFTINAGYQQTRNGSGVADNKVALLGGTYSIDPVKLFLSYMNHRSDTTVQKNDVWATGLSYAATPAIDLIGAYYYDRQSDVDGRKKAFAAMLNYKLSKRTNVYVQADHSKIDDGYATNSYDAYAFPLSIRDRNSITAGVRHQF